MAANKIFTDKCSCYSAIEAFARTKLSIGAGSGQLTPPETGTQTYSENSFLDVQ